MTWSRMLLLALALYGPAGGAAAQAGDAVRGRTLFARCSGCHALAPRGLPLAPALKGVVGRRPGHGPGAPASAALRAVRPPWSPRSLDAFLADPPAAVPGTTMSLRTPMARDRADIIAFLAAQR
jgi:cytochrome c